jgi:hypothetical protein
MNLIPSWLASLRSRRATSAPDTDLCDMGTTFGLDAAMPRLTEMSRDDLQKRRADDPRAQPEDRPTRPARL